MRIPWNANQAPEESPRARIAIFGATAAATAGLVLTAGVPVTAGVCLAATAVGHLVSWRGRHAPRRGRGQALLGILLAASVLYLVADLVFGVFGGALPQAKFALAALAITSFDLKSRRNLYSHLWHSLVILYVGALFAWDFTYLPLVLLWAVAMYAFLLYSRSSPRPAEAPAPRFGAVTTDLRRAAPWVAGWLALGSIAFVALPRFSGRPIAVPLLVSIPLSEQSTGEVLPAVLPLVGNTPAPGVDEGINLRVRGRLGDEVVFRVRAPAPSYWRAYTLEEYRGQSWARIRRNAIAIPPVASALAVRDEPQNSGPGLPQTFYIERALSAEVLLSYPVRELYFPARSLVLTPTGTVHAPYALRKGVTYAAVSQVRDLSPAALRRAGPILAGAAPEDLVLPGSIPGRVDQLADSLVAGKVLEYDRVAAITSFLRRNYRYSLDTPRLPSGADAVDEFLFVDHVGFCEQFASALTVLLRQEGIPARLAVGYSTGTGNSLTGTYTVQARDAHAWVEVLFPGVGWVPFDASPGFSNEPVAQAPHRWFLSDVSPSLPTALLGNLGQTTRLGGLALVAAALLLVGLALVRRRGRLSPVLRAYALAQRWVRVAGLAPRQPTQTPREHLLHVIAHAPEVGRALEPLVLAVESEIYADVAAVTRSTRALALSAARLRVQGLRR